MRRSISAFVLHPGVDAGVARLRADLADGTWDRRYGQLRAQQALDIGYRLVIADVGARPGP